jgi:hypothetical protein
MWFLSSEFGFVAVSTINEMLLDVVGICLLWVFST